MSPSQGGRGLRTLRASHKAFNFFVVITVNALMNLLFNMKKMHTIYMRGILFQFMLDFEVNIIICHTLSDVWQYGVKNPLFVFLYRCF